MKFDIQSLSIKDNFKDWLYNAYLLYKSSFATHTFIILFSFIVYFFFERVEMQIENISFLTFLIMYFLTTPFFHIYMFGIIYKNDKTSPSYHSVGFYKSTIFNIMKFQFYLMLLVISSILVVSLFYYALGTDGNSKEEVENLVVDKNIFLYLRESVGIHFKNGREMILFSYLTLFTFCSLSLKNTLNTFNIFFQKNKHIVLLFIFLYFLINALIDFLPKEFSILYIFITPYLMCLIYVVFKQGFFGMKPEKMTEKEKYEEGLYDLG